MDCNALEDSDRNRIVNISTNVQHTLHILCLIIFNDERIKRNTNTEIILKIVKLSTSTGSGTSLCTSVIELEITEELIVNIYNISDKLIFARFFGHLKIFHSRMFFVRSPYVFNLTIIHITEI